MVGPNFFLPLIQVVSSLSIARRVDGGNAAVNNL
jgi:hypothetical protein